MSRDRECVLRFFACGFLCLLALLAMAGCVERKLTIRSEPAGARVLLDGKYVGETPCTVEFMHYGTRELLLSKPGYERRRLYQKVQAPCFQWFPFDFFFELIWPFTLVDHQEFDFPLRPTSPTDEKALQERVDSLREQSERYEPQARPGGMEK